MNDLTLTNGTAIVPLDEEPVSEQTALHMAREFQEATAEIGRLLLAIKAQSQRMRIAFDPDAERYSPFDVDFKYDGQHYNAEDFDRIREKMARRAWRILFDHLGVKNVMSVQKRKEFEHQLERGELPDITEANILGVIGGLAGDAKAFARDAAKEVFDMLRPRGQWGGQYKTNDAFRVGRKVILSGKVERAWSGTRFRASYYAEQSLTALDGVFHLLDGKGIMREHKGPLVQAIEASPDGRGETAYFAFKCFKNRNLHLTMKRLDLVKELNGLAAGEYVLGEDME